MPNKKISQLVNKTSILSTDLFPIGDATSGQLYKKTIAELQAAIGGAVISVNGLVGTVVLDTDDIQELASPTNKYFTDARARGAVSATSPLAFNSSTGVFSIPAATTSANGYLTSADWNTFNGKENVLTFSSPLVRTTNTISIPAATTSVNGYLSSTDWNTFNNKQATLSLTVTGSSGASTLISNVLNIPTYTLAGLGGITASFLSGGTGITYNSGTGVIATTITQYTDALARASLSFTAGSGAYNSTTGVITIPTNTNQLTNGASFITLASLSGGTGISYNSTTGAISYSGTVYTDASIRGLFSGSTGISYNSTTGAISSTITQYTDALARGAISLTTSGTSGASTYNSTTGVLNIPNYGSALSGYLPLTGGTLTGALGGTSATFSGAFNVTAAYTTLYGLRLSGNDTDNTIYQATGALGISTGGGSIVFKPNLTTALTITSSGNLGLGVTPSAWTAGGSNIEVGSAGNIIQGQASQIAVIQNATYNSGWKYSANGYASFTLQTSGQHQWYIAPSGTAGTAISFTQAMTLDANGNLFVGATNSALNATRGLLLNGGSLGDVQFRLQNNNTGTTASDGLLISLASDNSMYVYNYENAALNFGTNNTIRATISAAGNVLIGTTTDSGYKLDVNGTGRFSGDLSVIKSSPNINLNAPAGSSAQYNINNSSGTLHWAMYSTIGGSGVQANWQLYSAGKTGGAGNVIDITPAGAATFSSSVTAGTDFIFNTSASLKWGSGTYIYGSNNTQMEARVNGNLGWYITSGANILLGTSTDNGERLYVSGAIRATGTITANSDIRLKKNLERIENALEKVGQISGYTYNTIYDDKRHGGVIAQEIDDVFPEIVNKGNDGLLGVEYGNISALLIEALKEATNKIKALESKVEALQK